MMPTSSRYKARLLRKPDSVPLTRLFNSASVALVVNACTVGSLRSPKSFLQAPSDMTQPSINNPYILVFFLILIVWKVEEEDLEVNGKMKGSSFTGRIWVH